MSGYSTSHYENLELISRFKDTNNPDIACYSENEIIKEIKEVIKKRFG